MSDATPRQVQPSEHGEDGVECAGRGTSKFCDPNARLVRCSDPKNDPQRSHLCGVWASPLSIEIGLAQVLVDYGLTDCAPNVWDKENCPVDLRRVWDPLPPPGYSPFERFVGSARPDDICPFQYMVWYLTQQKIVECATTNGSQTKCFVPFGKPGSHGTPRRIQHEDIALVLGIDVYTLLQLESFARDAYTLVYLRKFTHTYFDVVRPLHRAGHKVGYNAWHRYVLDCLPLCRNYTPVQLLGREDLLRLGRRPEFLKPMFETDSISPLKFLSIYFGRRWMRIVPLPMRVTNGELGKLLSKLNPAGRAYVCDFFNKTNYLPAVIYAEWVNGFVKDYANHSLSENWHPFPYSPLTLSDDGAESAACSHACSKQAKGHVTLLSLTESAKIGLFNSDESCVITIPIENVTPQAPKITLGLMPNIKTIVHAGSQIYYRESRDGVTRHIPLTRYPTQTELNSPSFQEIVEKAFATSVDAYAPSCNTGGSGRACRNGVDSCNANWLNPAYSSTTEGEAFTSA